MTLLQSGLAKSLAVDYTIDNSLRFNEPDAPKLSRTFSTGNRKVWTFSTWLKHWQDPDVNDYGEIFNGHTANTDTGFTAIYFYGGQLKVSGASTNWRITSQEFRDPSAWYHLVVAFDTTESAADDRCKIFINGSQVTAFATNNALSLDTDYGINGAWTHQVGQDNSASSSRNFSGYLAEVYFIDGAALDADDFAETNAATNQWIPKDASGLTFGTNGFYQKYGSTELANSFFDSGNGGRHVVTPNGGVHTDTAIKKFGTASAQFDGTTDYLSIPATSDFAIGTGNFTLECWVYHTSSGTAQNIIDMRDGSNGYKFDIEVTVDYVGFYSEKGPYHLKTSALSEDTWYHIAAVRLNGVMYLYLDGVYQSKIADTYNYSTSIPAIIGARYNAPSGGQEWDGYIDEIRHTKGLARYTSETGNFDVPTEAFTSDIDTMLLLHCDGANDGTSFPDSAGLPITPEGDVANTRAERKIGDSSISFDGTGDYLSIPDSPNWDFGSGEFTLEFFARLNTGFGNNVFMGHTYDPDTVPPRASWKIYRETNDLRFSYDVSSSSTELDFSYSWSADTWYHVALSRDGSGDIRAYIDGTQIGSTTAANVTFDTSTATLKIGADKISGVVSAVLNGYLDEIRISDTARYTGSSFTVPTTAFTSDSNTKLLIHSNWTGGLGADSSGNYNTFTPTNLAVTDQMIDTPTNNFCTLTLYRHVGRR